MSWLFSRALVAEFSAATYSGGGQSVLSNGSPTPPLYSPHVKTTVRSRLSRFGMTYEPFGALRGKALLTWFREGFLARTSASPAKAMDLMANGLGCGERWLGWWAKFDPNTYSWRTAQCSLLEDWELFSETWPRSGLMLLGKCFRLPNAEPNTSANESGLWPTPTVCGNYNRPGASATSGMGLASAVRLWPTPTAGSKKSGGTLQEWGGSWNWVREEDPELARGPLNPEWVEWLMGWPTGWTDLKPLETAKFREWQQQHGACSADERMAA